MSLQETALQSRSMTVAFQSINPTVAGLSDNNFHLYRQGEEIEEQSALTPSTGIEISRRDCSTVTVNDSSLLQWDRISCCGTVR